MDDTEIAALCRRCVSITGGVGVRNEAEVAVSVLQGAVLHEDQHEQQPEADQQGL